MGLDVPELDDRSFEELLTDARKHIPVNSESWTDHNLSDPGITMLEMLAWVAESDIYQLDRVTDRHVRKYLRLLGVRPRKPRQATTSVAVDPPTAAAGRELEERTQLAVDDAGTTRRFETTRSVTLTDAEVAAVISETPGERIDNTRPNETDGLHFLAFGRQARADSAVYVGFDADPFRDGDTLDLHVDYHEDDLPAPTDGDGVQFEPSVRVVWEHCTDIGRFTDPDAWEPVDDPEADERVEDGTDQLYHGGTISVPEPDGWRGTDHAAFDVVEALFWLRARVAEPGHEVPPQLNAFETGVVDAVHRADYRDERLARVREGASVEAARQRLDDADDTTTAQPGQEFVFSRAPVMDAEVTVGGDVWEPVDDFDAASPDEPAYVLDHERGVVRFGDGVRGAVPEPDQPVRATWYDHGGGTAGNVPADAAWQFVDESWAAVDVTPRGPAMGGAAAESTDAALARLKADLRRPYRAVTADDYRYLATHTPGLRFGRAAVHVETRGEPGGDCGRRGVVTVAVVPYSPPYRDRPVPSEGFLEAVSRHLRRHRLLTDELVVEAPAYVGVSVRADIEVAAGHTPDGTATRVEDALGRFLDPLEGFDGEGWPFGRPVYRSEIYATIEGVEGVDCVGDVDLSAGQPSSRGDAGIDIPPTALVYLADATVTVDVAGDRHGTWSR